MSQWRPVSEFLEEAKFTPVVDVRSPGEFLHGHIPGAKNIALFTDEERAIIGTIYKKNGREKAIVKGYEFVNPKLQEFISHASQIKNPRNLLVHCWRGGMRSAFMAGHFEKNGINASALKGGY